MPIPRFTLSRGALAASLSCGLGLLMVACGGGGDSSSTSTTPASTGVTTASYSGTVTGLGSIVVNGVRFATTGASTVDGDDPRLSHSSAFTLGSTVTVSGTVDDSTGQATTVTVHGGVRGAVSAASASALTLTVAGQAIKVDANTVFEGLAGATFNLSVIESLVAANTPVYVEVYGVADATNTVLATRIEQKSALAAGYAVLGKVASLNTTAKTFSLTLRSGTTVTVDYASADVLPTGVTLADGLAVRVRSAVNPATLSSGATLAATKVIVKGEKQSTGLAKLRGAVTAINGSIWTVGDVSVDVSKSPQLDDLSSLSAVTVGTVVKVKGTFVSGVLVATEVESDAHEARVNSGAVRLYGVVSGATAATGSSLATFAVQGVTISIASGSALSLPADASYVEVRAQLVNGVLTATAIETARSTAAKPFEVYGTVPCPNGSSDLSTTFTLTLRNASTTTVNGAAATIKAERGVSLTSVVANASCLVEVKGTSGGTSAVTASVIEVKSRN